MNEKINIMKLFKLFPCLYFLLIISNILYGQLYDGTIVPDTFIKEIGKNIAEESAMDFDLSSVNLSVKLSVSVHVIRDTSGFMQVTKSQALQVIDSANIFFNKIGIHFSMDTFDIVNDYNYLNISKNNNLSELLVTHSEANKINLYFVDSIVMDKNPSFGYTYFPTATDSNYIFLCRKYVSGINLTMMLGHFFGLLSAHERKGGTELANEKNCKTSGDFICDTYADPGLRNLVDKNCNYKGSSIDSNGDYYVPSVANIMSDSRENCKCIITPMQYRRMLYYYKKYRQNLM
jgi:hypothetical protein